GVFLFVARCFFFSKTPPKPVMAGAERKTLDSILDGLRFVFRTREVLAAMALDLFAVLFGGPVALIPVYARDILQVGPIGFGWLNAASDIGSMITIGAMALRPLRG